MSNQSSERSLSGPDTGNDCGEHAALGIRLVSPDCDKQYHRDYEHEYREPLFIGEDAVGVC